MKKIFIVFTFVLSALISVAQNPYYFGENPQLDPEIPTPESFFGFEIGSSLVRYDKVVEYFRLLAEKSDRASFEVFGLTNQHREQVKLIITSAENQNRLEDIRKSHLALIDPESSVDYSSEKVIVELAYNVHGGEIAGTDAAVLTAYYLAATQDPDLVNRLSEAVVLIEPSQNPDGRERAVNFINGFQNDPAITDPYDIGHSGGWTPHRGNQYWNDLNRDWLALSQTESKNRVAYYHRWYPNVYLDFHEMGSGSTYYFEPSPLSTWNKILPQSNYEVLTAILADHFSQALDKIGSLYFTKESFTNLSPIYGSTYPDYQGGVGVTLEVGSTSGVAVETDAGIRTFSKNLKDNFEVGVAALIAATNEKETFLQEQKAFFESAREQADELDSKFIVFGAEDDRSLNRLFLDHLLRHQIEVYELPESVTEKGKTFEPGRAYVVPLRQAHFRILQSIFEENETNKYDGNTTFYDISGWSTVHGYGIPFFKSASGINLGERVEDLPGIAADSVDRSQLAYAFDFQEFLAPKALYFIQSKGLIPRVAHRAFTSKTSKGDHHFAAGSILIPIAYQTKSADEVYQILQEATKLGVEVHAINGGFSVDGIDLGSNNIKVVKKPEIALITGGNWTAFGEIWSLLNDVYKIPVVKVKQENVENVDLSRYTSIVLTGGQYSDTFASNLSNWVENGGTLVSLNGSTNWVSKSLFPKPSAVSDSVKGDGKGDVVGRPGTSGERLTGIILRANLDLRNPAAFGITDSNRYTLKTSIGGLDSSIVEQVILTSTDTLISGYAEAETLAKLGGNIVVGSISKGRGAVVYFAESPAFRGYWFSSSRLLVNTLFFGVNSGRRRY